MGESRQKKSQLETEIKALNQRLADKELEVADYKRMVEIFRDSEVRYRQLYDSIIDAFARVDMDGRIIEFNRAFQNMLGYEPVELLNLKFSDVTPTKWHELETEIIAKQVRTRGYSDIYEKEYQRKDGTVFPVELRTTLMRDETGAPIGMWVEVRDITERKRIQEIEHEQRTLAEALRDIAAALNSSLKLNEVLDLMITHVARIVPYDAIAIALLDEGRSTTLRHRGLLERGMGAVVSDWQSDTNSIPSFRKIMETRQIALVPDTRRDLDWATFPEPGWVLSAITVPILFSNTVIGMVCLYSETPDFYTDKYLLRLQTFANQAAIAIKNAYLYTKVEYLAVADPLTNLYNRRGLFEFGQNEVRRVQRFKRPLSVLFVDIDHFKVFNDTYGYAIGDRVLQTVAYQLRINLRNVDLVCRYGGEEFVCLLPEIDQVAAMEVAERVRRDIEQKHISTDRGNLNITVSIGVSSLRPAPGKTGELIGRERALLREVVEKSGEMLHMAKEKGRNRVEAGEAIDDE